MLEMQIWGTQAKKHEQWRRKGVSQVQDFQLKASLESLRAKAGGGYAKGSKSRVRHAPPHEALEASRKNTQPRFPLLNPQNQVFVYTNRYIFIYNTLYYIEVHKYAKNITGWVSGNANTQQKHQLYVFCYIKINIYKI